MQTIHAVTSVVVWGGACALVGCSGGAGSASSGAPGGAVSTAALEAHFDNPDGSITATSLVTLIQSMNELSAYFATKQELIKPTLKTCAAVEEDQVEGTCDCPASGSFEYTLDRPPAGAMGPVSGSGVWRYAGCSTASATFDGTISIDAHADADRKLAGDQFVVVELVVSHGGGAGTKIDAAARTNGATAGTYVAFHLDEGWVVMASPDGVKATLRDRAGQWTCDGQTTHGSCSRDGATPPTTYTY